jgi:hypothetical protein
VRTNEPELLTRLEAALASQGDPMISVDRRSTAVVAFEVNTADLMFAVGSSRRSKWPSDRGGSSSRVPSSRPGDDTDGDRPSHGNHRASAKTNLAPA